MSSRRHSLILGAAGAIALLQAGCTGLPGSEPVRVNVVGIEPLPGQGMELRFKVRLRVQNPNETAIAFEGLFIELDVQGRTFATGVSDARGTIPRYGEAVLEVPVSVSALSALRQIIGVAASGQMPEKIDYQLRGRIGGPLFGGVRFDHKGQLALPGEAVRGARS